jgi:hypothetical protein
VKERRLKFAGLHGNMSTAEAARSFLERNLGSLPLQARPEPAEVEEVAHLFASYLTTSFEPAAVRRISDGCPCSFCTYLVAAPHLQVKTPTRNDHSLARKLEVNALEALSLELPLLASELAQFVASHPELERDIATVAWAVEILRRGQFRGQGEPVLALWREMAWKEGRPDRRFEPTPELVLAAEAKIAGVLKTYFPASP